MIKVQPLNSESPALEIDPQDSKLSRFLVIRPDRLGDVILSTPVFEAIKSYYPNSSLTILVKENVVPVLKGLSSVDQVMIYDPEVRHAGIRGFFRLVREIRQAQFRVAVVLQTQWKIAAAVFFARVRYRIGPKSKFHSFLFFNRGIRQHRSRVEMHEADYNLQLLRELGIRVGTRNISTRVSISEETQTSAREWLAERHWDPKKPLILVHPGMGGSALNWPETHYHELLRALVLGGRQILVTGGPLEGPLLDRVEKELGTLKDRVLFYRASPLSSVDFLGGLCSYASLVVAPSTGPLHLATALGKRILTFFPPVRVMSALRWGPYLPNESEASILVPEVYCGQDFKCAGNLCHYFPCMKGLTVKQAIEQVNLQLASLKTNRENKETDHGESSLKDYQGQGQQI